MRTELLKSAWSIAQQKDHRLPFGKDSSDIMMVPAPTLTDVAVMKAGLRD
jgi:hypothetical protein